MIVTLSITLPDSEHGDTSLMELQDMHFHDKTIIIATATNAPVIAKLDHLSFRSA